MDAELLNYAGKLGRIASETRVEIARVGMAVATRAGGLKPDISTLAAFRQMLVDAKSITYPPEGFIGIHLSKVIDQLGIAEQVKSKTIPQETITNVPLAVAGGEAEFGFGPKTVLASASGIEMVDLFPTEIQKYIVYTAAISSAASQSNAAIGFVKYLLSPDASALLKAKGFEPIE